MYSWIREFERGRRIAKRERNPRSLPPVQAQRITSTSGALKDIDIWDQYILAVYYFLEKATFSFYNPDGVPWITSALRRFIRYTAEGKVWNVDGTPQLLQIQRVTEDAMSMFSKLVANDEIAPVIQQLFLTVKPYKEEIPPTIEVPEELKGKSYFIVKHREPPLPIYEVVRDHVPYLEMTSDLKQICDFLENTDVDPTFSTRVTGWCLEELQEPNDIIRMLAHRYEQVLLFPEPDNINQLAAIRAYQ